MAVRNTYSQAERQMLEAEAKRFDGMVGWHEPRRPMVATEDSIRRVGLGVDPWNPLWHDEVYAAATRWGSLAAYPTYQGFFGATGIMELRAPAECGTQYMIWIGEDYEFHRPIRPGDVFRVWVARPELFDVTPPGDGPRVYGLIEGDLDYYNQHSELVGSLRNFVQRTFRVDRPPVHPMPEYSYTADEIRYIGRLMRGEEITGATVRYWDDVQVGDELRPIVTGPTNMGTNSLTSAITPDLGDFFRHARDFYLMSLPEGGELGPEFIFDPAKDRYLIRGGMMSRHWSDLAAQAEGEPCAWLFGVVSRFSLLRILTNWMGDDGFVRRFKWRHMTRTRVGDTMVARARVVGKRQQHGEYLVDLQVWLRNLRGNVSEAAVATVALPARDAGPVAAQSGTSSETAHGAPTGHSVQAARPAPFSEGDRVRFKAQPDWPADPGFRFEGAEGTVIKWVEYEDAMADFSDVVVCVRIESAHGEGEAYIGSPLLFRPEDMEIAAQ
jgi:acyl dehydratase